MTPFAYFPFTKIDRRFHAVFAIHLDVFCKHRGINTRNNDHTIFLHIWPKEWSHFWLLPISFYVFVHKTLCRRLSIVNEVQWCFQIRSAFLRSRYSATYYLNFPFWFRRMKSFSDFSARFFMARLLKRCRGKEKSMLCEWD